MSTPQDFEWVGPQELDTKISTGRKASRSRSRSKKTHLSDSDAVNQEEYGLGHSNDFYEEKRSRRRRSRSRREADDMVESAMGDEKFDAVEESQPSSGKKRSSSKKHRRKRSTRSSKAAFDVPQYEEEVVPQSPIYGYVSHDLPQSPQWDEPVQDSQEPGIFSPDDTKILEHDFEQYEAPVKPRRRGRLLLVFVTLFFLLAGGGGFALYFFVFRKGSQTSSAAVLPQNGTVDVGGTPTATTAAGTPTASPIAYVNSSSMHPAPGKLWFGVAIDEDFRDVAKTWNLSGKGVMPKLVNIFWTMTNDIKDPRYLAGNMTHYATNSSTLPPGSVIEITLMPMAGLEVATDELMLLFANAFKVVNEKYAVILRFGHEMNGNWYPWCRQPTLYKSTFRRFAATIRSVTPYTAMFWAPTISDTYPFSAYSIPAPNTTDFAALDTNNNSIIDHGDDPYAPYYPGDDVVDWVGGTVYYYGPLWPYVNNYLPNRTYLEWTITGKSVVDGSTVSPSFYDVYAAGKNKSMMYAEIGLYHWPNGTGVDAMTQKQAWWRQLADRTTRAKFPLIRAFAWFEVAKIEPGWDNQFIDFKIGSNSSTMQAFLNDISPSGSAQSNIDPDSLEWAIDYR
ncbi:hypothetical protein HDU93_008861 [Gonapodya sp. JEL0774]|nr:hypothetical protein HDU93_008861 [Gonapodya sp. JEL0774]